MTSRTGSTPDLPHTHEAVLPDGRTITVGTEFSVKGEGRFRFHYTYKPDGSIAAFGPVARDDAKWRAFKPEQVARVHRDRTVIENGKMRRVTV